MSVTTELAEFERALRAKCRTWSEAAEEMGARPGLRAVPFSGDLLREALLSGFTKKWLDQIFEQLPKDAVVMDLMGEGRLVHLSLAPGSYFDRYSFVVASKEWPTLPEGSFIPEFVPVFQSQWACVGGCGYTDNALERKTCEVCGRGRGD